MNLKEKDIIEKTKPLDTEKIPIRLPDSAYYVGDGKWADASSSKTYTLAEVL